MKIKNRAAILFTLFSLISACAPNSYEVKPGKIDENFFSQYDCNSLLALARTNILMDRDVSTKLDAVATGDNVQAMLGSFLFFPILFALDGNSEIIDIVSRVKSEAITIKKMAERKQCETVLELYSNNNLSDYYTPQTQNTANTESDSDF